METILIAGLLQALLFSVLIFRKKEKNIADYVLASWLLSISLFLLFEYFYYSGIILKYPHLLGIKQFFPMLQGPFLFIYTITIISKNVTFKKRYLLHVLPFIAINIYGLFDFYLLGAEEKLKYYEALSLDMKSNIIYLLGYIHIYFNGPIYIILSIFKLRNHKKNIVNNFSYYEKINLDWLKYVLAGLSFIWLAVLLEYFIDVVEPFSQYGPHLVNLSVVFAIYFIGYFGLKQAKIYTSISQYDSNDGIKRHRSEQISLDKLLGYMEKEKPYLDGKLSLKALADLLDLTPNNLSRLINTELDKNFFDFINEYRVEETKKCIASSEYKNYTLLAIAQRCGFSSKSSFNSIFKEITGYTPSKYRGNFYI